MLVYLKLTLLALAAPSPMPCKSLNPVLLADGVLWWDEAPLALLPKGDEDEEGTGLGPLVLVGGGAAGPEYST